MSNVGIAFLLTIFAGLSTGIGSLIALFSKRTNQKFLSVSLGFSAGVMIFVSFVEILQDSIESLSNVFGEKSGMIYAILAFFGGMLLIAIIDKIIPEKNNPHEQHNKDLLGDNDVEKTKNKSLFRSGIMTAFALAIHNFPEGMASFVSALQDPSVAIPIVLAIAIHNIPEGISVSVPIYYATGNRKKACLLSFASGLAEPLGAVVCYLILMPFLNNTVYGILFGMVAGIMVYISFDELLPSAEEYGEHHLCIYGLLGGMAVMALSMWLFV